LNPEPKIHFQSLTTHLFYATAKTFQNQYKPISNLRNSSNFDPPLSPINQKPTAPNSNSNQNTSCITDQKRLFCFPNLVPLPHIIVCPPSAHSTTKRVQSRFSDRCAWSLSPWLQATQKLHARFNHHTAVHRNYRVLCSPVLFLIIGMSVQRVC
jgi:hypothetical protein